MHLSKGLIEEAESARERKKVGMCWQQRYYNVDYFHRIDDVEKRLRARVSAREMLKEDYAKL